MDDSTALRKFIVKLSIKFILLGIACAAVFYFFAQQHYFNFVPVIFIYFYLLNLLSFYILVKSHNLPMGQFSKRFILISSGKLFSSLIFAITFVILSRENMIPFLVIFIILYFSSLIQLVREFNVYLNQKKSE
ncbi:MAG: hypothetical protein PHT92_01605 [Bacteroidales bacterium]|jgi:hypothetical protein|nr:hypothetical protein [Bacteroidales bacterium]